MNAFIRFEQVANEVGSDETSSTCDQYLLRRMCRHSLSILSTDGSCYTDSIECRAYDSAGIACSFADWVEILRCYALARFAIAGDSDR